MTPDDEVTMNAIREWYAAGAHPISPNALREMCRQYDPGTDRWYYQMPAAMRTGMEQQGYDADDYFAKVSADWGDPNA